MVVNDFIEAKLVEICVSLIEIGADKIPISCKK
jgi:hypothetical protein